MSNPFEGSYDPSNIVDVMRQERDEAWNVHTANGDYSQALEQLQASLDTPGADDRELNQTLGYEARVQWLKGEDEVAVDGMRAALADLKANRRADIAQHRWWRDQYEDHHLPWSAAIEATSQTGSRLRGFGQAVLSVAFAPFSQSVRFRGGVDPNANRGAEMKSRLMKSTGALAVAGLAFVSRGRARELAHNNFAPRPATAAVVHGLEDRAGQ